MGAPGYSIIRPALNIDSIEQMTEDSKLCQIGTAEKICKKISNVFTDISWEEEITDTARHLVATVQTENNLFSIHFEVERIYVKETVIKWIHIDPESEQDVAKEARLLADTLGCVVLDWQNLRFL